jgi:hypothetical protein
MPRQYWHQDDIVDIACPLCGETIRIAKIPATTFEKRQRHRAREHMNARHAGIDIEERERVLNILDGTPDRKAVVFTADNPPDWETD